MIVNFCNPVQAEGMLLFLHTELYHYIFMISQLWLTSHPRSTVVLLDTGTPGTSRDIYSEDANGETFSAGTRSSCVQ